MTAKEKVEQDLKNIEAAMEQLKVDVELLGDEEKAEMKEKSVSILVNFLMKLRKSKSLTVHLLKNSVNTVSVSSMPALVFWPLPELTS